MKRTIGIIIMVFLSAFPLSAEADTKIAVLISNEGTPFEEALSGFQDVFRRQGIQAEIDLYRLAGDPARATAIVQKLKNGSAKVLYTIGSLATDTAAGEIHDIPIVACMIVRADNYRKTDNITGVVLEFPLETQFKWIRQFLPNSRNVGVVYNPRENRERIESAVRVAQKMGLVLFAQEADAPRDLPVALDMLERNVDALWGVVDNVVLTPQTTKNILLFSFRNSIPFIGLSESWVKAGALFSLDGDYADIGMQCGEVTLKVLRGTPPGSIPWAPPRKVLHSLNLNTARQMKIRIPDELISTARRVY